MEINKQLFEDVLSGKLKGTFVLRNGDKWDYWLIKRPDRECLRDKYELNFQGEVVYDFRCLIFEDNGMCNIGTISPLDIIDFLPETNMKEKKNMKINKQLFDDVLSGKLKGTFILTNGTTINSNSNKLIYTCGPYQEYRFEGIPYIFDCDGRSISPGGLSIIDFIPDTDMKENELTIEIPEGKEIDWDESKKQNKIVFKKKDTKPRSWEEYCRLQKKSYAVGYFINSYCDVSETEWSTFYVETNEWRRTIPSKELAEAFLAMMQLMSLRQAWIGDWKPNYYMNMASNWGIEYEPNPGVFSIENHCRTNGGGLTFPTKEMATDFMNTFKDLLETAKPLI